MSSSMASMSKLFGHNKDRFYIAYYPRGATPDDPVKFHTALLLVPKNPKDLSSKDAYRFHVKNTVGVVDGQAKQIWVYEGKPAQNRTTQLWAVQLLGKLDKAWTGEALDQLLKEKVEVVQDDPNWRCRHWVWNAMRVLANANIINFPGQPEDVWNAGLTFCDNTKMEPNKPVPACDAAGTAIASEF